MLLIFVFLLPSHLYHAWSEGSHHSIAAVAFGLLTEKERTELLGVLKKHPRYAEDFVPLEKLLANLLSQTHVFNIDPNYPHSVGMFVAHRVI